MANVDTVEIGWIIYDFTDTDDFAYRGPLFDKAEKDENGYFIPESDDETDDGEVLYIETHPHDTKRVFVKLWDTCHGFDLEGVVEPRGLGSLVREYIKKHDPNAVVRFGIIVTER